MWRLHFSHVTISVFSSSRCSVAYDILKLAGLSFGGCHYVVVVKYIQCVGVMQFILFFLDACAFCPGVILRTPELALVLRCNMFVVQLCCEVSFIQKIWLLCSIPWYKSSERYLSRCSEEKRLTQRVQCTLALFWQQLNYVFVCLSL